MKKSIWMKRIAGTLALAFLLFGAVQVDSKARLELFPEVERVTKVPPVITWSSVIQGWRKGASSACVGIDIWPDAIIIVVSSICPKKNT